MNPALIDNVKLVVWDLDDTFWSGTLTEGGAAFREEMHQAAVRLSEHGIINSIASNNELERAREVLERWGSWTYFVFPEVSWTQKAEMVRAILANTQLRAENTIFLDDKRRIREGVAAGLEKLLATCTAEEFLAAFETWRAGREPADPRLERLNQYKLLETKSAARQAFVGSGAGGSEDFLRASDVRCRVLRVGADLANRVEELIHRTNQLNYTRKRVSRQELDALLADPRFECRAVHVEDRFGDYGVCGFYALRRRERVLEHFLFSCRALQMGVEGAILRRLGMPAIEAAGDQAAAAARLLAEAARVDWVAITGEEQVAAASPAAGAVADSAVSGTGAAKGPRPPAVLFIGPCELDILGSALTRSARGVLEPRSLVQYRNRDGRLISHFGHHALLQLASRPDLCERWQADLARIPWFDTPLVDPVIFRPGCPKVVVLSSVRNAQSADYRHRSGEFCVPFDYFIAGGIDLTSRGDAASAGEYLRLYDDKVARGFLEWFAENFEFVGPVSRDGYEESLRWLARALPEDCRLVVINVPDVRECPVAVDGERERALVERWRAGHAAVNGAIERCAEALPGKVAVLDVNRHLRGPEDFRFDEGPRQGPLGMFFRLAGHYHYQRRVYASLSAELLGLLAAV